jgi:hypothetical protein
MMCHVHANLGVPYSIYMWGSCIKQHNHRWTFHNNCVVVVRKVTFTHNQTRPYELCLVPKQHNVMYCEGSRIIIPCPNKECQLVYHFIFLLKMFHYFALARNKLLLNWVEILHTKKIVFISLACFSDICGVSIACGHNIVTGIVCNKFIIFMPG